jgi:hypothetical protein
VRRDKETDVGRERNVAESREGCEATKGIKERNIRPRVSNVK